MNRVVSWVVLAAVVAMVSAVAVWARLAQYPMWLPRPLPAVLEWFVEPGVLVWWLTIAGLFEGYPSSLAGHAVVVVGNTMLWMTLAAVGVWLVRRIARLR